MSRTTERQIEAIMAERLGRPCLFLPSGRLALYVALRAWVKPAGRLLMSPVTDDVVLFTVLAAGLEPVMAPVSARDGNLEPASVPDHVWESVAGVVTTNLYGLPDRVEELRSRCQKLRIPLIEDAAHAIETTVGGSPVGTFGEAAAFSLSKHVDAHCGGVLAFGDPAERPDLERLRDEALDPSGLRKRATRTATFAAEAAVVGLHLVWPARLLRRRLRLVERTTSRMPLRAAELRRAIAAGPGLRAFDPWVRVDRHDYRVPPPAFLLERALRRLRDLERDAARRVEGVARLRSLPVAAPAARDGEPQPLFRVPLLVEDRPAVIGRLERRLRHTGYIYDPPLDDYAAPEFARPAPAPDTARWWARHVLPVDPLEAVEAVEGLRITPPRLILQAQKA